MKNRNSVVDAVFTVLWIVFLFSGIALKLTTDKFNWPRMAKTENAENRRLARFPALREIPDKGWGRAYEAWYNDHFAMRQPIIDCYKDLHFHVFKSPVKRFVPGRGDWIFGRMGHDGGAGDVWPEVEDYMGVVKLDESIIDNWTTLFEGRAAWAEAHGIHYLEVLPPMKSKVHPEKMLPMISMHRRESGSEDLRKALSVSTASSNVLFLADAMQAEVAAGNEVFYEEDHHENAYGCFCIYRDIFARIREMWYPELGEFPFYQGDVPQEVLNGRAPGCWVTADRRLSVRNPSMRVVDNPSLGIAAVNPSFPHGPVCVARDGEGIKILVGHDSFLRYPFDTWFSKDMAAFTLPVGDGVAKMSMFIFTRFNTPRLDELITKELPDVIIEEFSEGRLQFGTNGKNYNFLDNTMRKAADWSHGKPVSEENVSENGVVMAVAVLDDLRSSLPGKPVTVELRDKDESAVASEVVKPGLRRAVFFGKIPAQKGLHCVVVGGDAAATRVEFRFDESGGGRL